MATTAKNLWDFLPFWYELLQQWSLSGRLSAAAQEALLLDGEPQPLQDLVSKWSAGDFEGIPEIVLLSNAEINGALGAYAQSTGKIYLNADWLAGASQEQVMAVLTEELGHHLDGLLNGSDTPGDEGELFAALLSSDKLVNPDDRQRMLADRDEGNLTGDFSNLSHKKQPEQAEAESATNISGILSTKIAAERDGGPSNDPDEVFELAVEFSLAQYFRPTPGLGVASIADSDVFKLESNPDSSVTLNLRFQGYDLRDTNWNYTSTPDRGKLDSMPIFSLDDKVDTEFSAEELRAIKEIFLRVAADYAPFDVNVTTKYQLGINPFALSGPTDRYNDDITLLSESDDKYGISAVIGSSGGKATMGGVAIVNAIRYAETIPQLAPSGKPIIPLWIPILGPAYESVRLLWGVAQTLVLPAGNFVKPALIFSDNLNGIRQMAEAVSHELGHTLGLSHDGINNGIILPEPEYYTGRGEDPGWGPIMGSSGHGDLQITQFSRGEYAGATNTENDFEIFTHAGVGRLLDDNTVVQPQYAFSDANGTEIYFDRDDIGYAYGDINLMSTDGLAPTDEDWFAFTAPRTGRVQITATNALSFSVIGKGTQFVIHRCRQYTYSRLGYQWSTGC